MNEMFVVFGQSLCEPCANAELARRESGKEKIPVGSVTRQVDPTICFRCKNDHGDLALASVSTLPVCEPCHSFVMHHPFPVWVKASFAALVALAVVSFAHNYRFFAAYAEVQQATRAIKSQQLPRAWSLMESAAQHVPEDAELQSAASFYHGLQLMQEGHFADAAELLRRCRQAHPESPVIGQLLLKAEGAAAFEQQDYDAMLAKQLALMRMLPEDPMAVASVSSAYACKYAVSGEEQFKKESLRYLERARGMAPRDQTQFAEYEVRVHHRLTTREILSPREFEQRYPQGWKAE